MQINLRFLLFLLLTFPAMTQIISPQQMETYIQTAERFVRSSLQFQRGYAWLGELCSLGSRHSGTESLGNAVEYARHKMESLDLDSVWLQEVHVPNWERGSESAVILTSGGRVVKELSISALGGTVPAQNLTAPIIEIHSFEELTERAAEVRGKCVFFNKPFESGLLDPFASYGTVAPFRIHGAEEASKYGAVCVIVRSISSRSDNIPHTGVVVYNDENPDIPAAAIGILDADALSTMLKGNPDILLNLTLNCRTLPDAITYNVIGELHGTEFPDEVILIGGHFDSWDVGEGAHDDGAGCMQALEVLDLFKRLEIAPKRTIRCVFFANEENGLKGGIRYGEYSEQSPEKHVAAIEADRGAGSPLGFYVDADSLTLEKIQSFLPALQMAGIQFVKAGGSGADIGKITTAQALIGYVPDSQDYFDYHHSANDVFAAVHPRKFSLGSAAMAILVYLIDQEGL